MFSIRKISALVIGSLFISVGINFFLTPLRVLDGGLIGIALVFNYLLKLKVGMVMIVCSTPIFLLAWFKNRAMLYSSINGLLLSSYLTDLLAPYQYHFLYYFEWTPFARAIIGGTIIGTGIGLMLRYGISTGGTDLLAQILSQYMPINVGVMILLMDGVIVGTGSLLLADSALILSLLTIVAGGIATSLCTLSTGKRHGH